MRLPHWRRHPFLLATGLGFLLLLAFSLATGFRWGDAMALFRHLRHRRTPDAVSLRRPDGPPNLSDFLPAEALLVIQEAGLFRQSSGTLSSLLPNQGFIRIFPGEGQIWLSASYHRLLSLRPGGTLRFELALPGVIREVKQHGDLLAVAFEEDTPEPLGRIRLFRRVGEFWDPTGVEVPIGLNRWCGFDLSPEGTQLLANRPGKRGVAVWTVGEGRALAHWDSQRFARLLHFLPTGEVCFDRGPTQKGGEGRLADPRNEVVRAKLEPGSPVQVLFQGFAQVLAATAWPDRKRLAFSDAEGMLRVLEPMTAAPPREFSPRDRGVPLRLRAQGAGLWVLFKGEQVRLERFDLR